MSSACAPPHSSPPASCTSRFRASSPPTPARPWSAYRSASASPTSSPTGCTTSSPTCTGRSAGRYWSSSSWRPCGSASTPGGAGCGSSGRRRPRATPRRRPGEQPACYSRRQIVVTTGERKPWHAIFRLLERDERVFAVLLAVAMVGGLATLGLVPLRPRQSIDLYSLVIWFALYKLGIFALVTVTPRATRAIFLGALAIDLLLVFVLLFLTGGGDSLFYLLFFPLVAVNGYYFGPWVALAASLIAGGLIAAAAAPVPPWI